MSCLQLHYQMKTQKNRFVTEHDLIYGSKGHILQKLGRCEKNKTVQTIFLYTFYEQEVCVKLYHFLTNLRLDLDWVIMKSNQRLRKSSSYS